MSELLRHARLYFDKWCVTPVPIKYEGDRQVPLLKWGALFDKEEPVLVDKAELWVQAHGIAVLPRGNHVIVDLDVFMNNEQRMNVAKYMSRQGYAVVITRRGLHIHFNVKQPVGELRLYDIDGNRVGEGGGSKYKHIWACPPTNRNGFIYKFYGHDTVPELITIPGIDEFELDIAAVYFVKVHQVVSTSITGNNIVLEAIDPIPGIEKLSTDELLALLAGVYHAINCNGLRDLVLEWLTTGKVNMRKFGWANRTSRFFFLHTITATLALLGATEQQVAEVLNGYEDLDGKPHDAHKSALWTVYKWGEGENKKHVDLFRRLYVLKRGECFFCSIRGYRNCGKNPVMRIYWWLQSRGREIVEDLVNHILSKRDNQQ